jgi:hypothetical protein
VCTCPVWSTTALLKEQGCEAGSLSDGEVDWEPWDLGSAVALLSEAW